jgi:hypothetical protein
MKNLRSMLFGLTALLLATAAQAQQTSVTATVPFAFMVGDRSYPAGEYAIKSLSDNGIALRIENIQASDKGIVLSNSCTSVQPAAGTKLVFQRLGDNYFLYQIWTEGNSAGREFPMSNAEVHIAKDYGKPELVLVAANISH